MPMTISFDQMQIENVVIFEKEGQWKIGVNVSLKSGNEGNLGRNVVFQLDEAQQLQVRKFLKPYIQTVRDTMDIQDVANFVDPEVDPEEEEEVNVIEPTP